MAYVYAVLHAPTYRERYGEFLRIDFPRVPFPENLDDFRRLAELGQVLMEAHLMRVVPDSGLAKYAYEGAEKADHEVREVRYDTRRQRLWINDTTFFAPVPENVWNFHIGGYQVLAKYLKDRKGRTLSLDDIRQVERIANILAFTIEHMQRIDAAYRQVFNLPQGSGQVEATD